MPVCALVCAFISHELSLNMSYCCNHIKIKTLMVTSGSYAPAQETRVAWQQSSTYSSFHIYSEMFLVLIIITTDQTHLKLCFNVF